MEKVYIVIVVAVAVVVLVTIYLLRERIRKGILNLSLKDKSLHMEVAADPQHCDNKAEPEQTRVQKGIIGNVVTGRSHIRTPESARVINNKVSKGSGIDITPSPEQDKKKK